MAALRTCKEPLAYSLYRSSKYGEYIAFVSEKQPDIEHLLHQP